MLHSLKDSLPDSVRIYSSRICGWAIRNYSALIEKEVEFLLISAKDPTGDKTPEFLALSPVQQTPVLQHGEVIVWDSKIINEYIEEAFSGHSLIPSGPAERAQLRNLTHYCDDVLMPLISRVIRKDGQDHSGNELANRISSLESFAFVKEKNGPYWAGSKFTLLDICYLNFFDNLDYLNNCADIPQTELSQRLQEWKNAIEERPSVISARKIFEEFASNDITIAIRP